MCYYCERPIPVGEPAPKSTNTDAWAHFECWYDGGAFLNRDPETGERMGRGYIPSNIELGYN